jgi:hypothetical protein
LNKEIWRPAIKNDSGAILQNEPGRLRQRHGLIVKGKRISRPPHHDYEHGFPLIRSLRASAQRSTSVLFSFVLSLLIVAGSFAIRQSKTIVARFGEAGRGSIQSTRVVRIIAARSYHFLIATSIILSLPCGEQKRQNPSREICVNWPARGCPTGRAKWLGLHRSKGGLLANGQIVREALL